jgi:ribosomal protein S15P/S13E
MSCINKNSQEFKHLLMQSKLPEPVVEAKVSIWQEQHGLDSFPTVSDLPGIKEPIREVIPNVEVKPVDTFKEQVVNLKRSIANVTNIIARTPKDSARYEKLKAMEANMKDLLAKYEVSNNKAYLYELAEIDLDNIEFIIKNYEMGNRETSVKRVAEVLDRLDSLYFLPEVAPRVAELKKRFTFIASHIVQNTVEEVSNIKEGKTYEQLMSDTKDIGGFEKYTGSLSNVENKIASSIGALIKKTQLDISGKQGEVYESIKAETEKIQKYAKDNNMSVKEVYELFIQDTGKTTVLTRPYTTEFYDMLSTARKAKDKSIYKFATYDETKGSFVPIDVKRFSNPNYVKIQKTPELKAFYTFYQKTIKEAFDRLPITRQTEWVKEHPEDFIPNIFTESLTDIIKTEGLGNKFKGLVKYITRMKVYEIKNSDFVKDASLERDIIPVQYLTKLTGENKSKDLGESLFKFAAMTIEHEELSEILPQARLMQRSLADNKFINPHKANTLIDGNESNIYEMVDGFINMQILGKKTKGKDEVKVADLYDEQGEVIGKKVIKAGELADFGLKWNSLLRIGLNPFTALTNVIVGETGNITEAAGGRFFNFTDLNKATGLFFNQTFSKDSKMHALVEKYPMLQELTDYEYAANISIRQGLTGEKLKNYMYAPQKAGEVFLQTRTMVAMMLHTKPDGKTSLWEMLDEKGEVKPEFLKHFGTQAEFKDYMLRMSTRIMGVNEQIHGRYSTRDAAILNQNVWARMAFQFKKWIPAAIESRFGERKFSDRLMVDTEGRWRTVKNLIVNLKDTADRYNKGQLTELEIYNFKKTMMEATILLATIVGAMALGWDDDEKRKKSAWYKETMNQLDKVSGDLLFAANPKNITAMSKSPFAVTKLANSLLTVMWDIPNGAYLGDYKVKTGVHKGENKFYRELGSIVPIYNQLGQNIPELWNEKKYVERVSR